VETLCNMRTVSALVLEDKRFEVYEDALKRDEPSYRVNAFSIGASAALALSLVQAVNAFLFWFGGWLMIYEGYSFNSFLIASFGILFSFIGLGSAFSGLSDRAQVEKSAGRVLHLLDRSSLIDPLSDDGKVLDEEK
jgi:ATP-binding cassette, subfamily B (MDR/TAP), member 1